MKGIYIVLAFVFVIVIIMVIIHKVKSRIRSFSNEVFGTDSIRQGLQNGSRILAETPKSVSGMTKIFLPQIERDFPQFNYAEYKVLAENILRASLLSISNQDVSILASVNASEILREEIRLRIDDDKKQGNIQHFENVQIYQTEITKYTKQNGICMITLQMAVGHLYYVTTHGTVSSGSKELTKQTKYNVELIYIQDAQKAALEGSAVGVTCPNCGAPVRTLGKKFCEYCGSAVIEINLHTWSIYHFYEV